MNRYKSLNIADVTTQFVFSLGTFILPALLFLLFKIGDISSISPTLNLTILILFVEFILPTIGILYFTYIIYVYSYTLEISENGELIETQLFNKQRCLSFKEVNSIVLSFGKLWWLLKIGPLMPYPRLINDKYKSFPKYGFYDGGESAKEIIKHIKESNQNVLMDEPTKEFVKGPTIFTRHLNPLMKKQIFIRSILAIIAAILISWLFLR